MWNIEKISLAEVFKSLEEFAPNAIISEVPLNMPAALTPSSLKHIVEEGLYFVVGDGTGYLDKIYRSVILTDLPKESFNENVIVVVDDPQLMHYKLTALLERRVQPDIHSTALVSPKAEIHPSVFIGPYCVIGECILEEGVHLGSHVVVNDRVLIGQNTVVESSTVIGARGMAWIWDTNGERVLQPQLGGVVIGPDCKIGTNITIVRGSLTENTQIGRGTVIAHGSLIGHGSVVGEYVHFANNVSLAGNAVIGKRTFLGSACVISSNVTIASGCIIGAGSVVNKTVHEENVTIVGVPGRIIREENFRHKPNGAPKPFK